MKRSKLALNFAAIAFAAFGLILFIAPGIMKSVGVEFADKAGAVELRAFYGGIELGLAAFFALAARRPEWIRIALTGLVLALGGIVILRGFALLIAGFQANLLIYLCWLGETALFVYALLALARNESE
ncbi:MAG: DUF4345 family protein [Candidatus Marinimicrobia bacterium]|jgi:hypothetical protein|nr:DUF4345 family protein [Candidatus Neomarinimicrobiota bacterium]MDD4960818.1 DUF4345 family protein [Candidatus Neomarinimicrobiota bacterium]MDD5709630.1 DUF4345 family protein [Candidatus Neomarinimicrobiota bacterium]MDX9777377.1 DUF4345 family protein [bacterium]